MPVYSQYFLDAGLHPEMIHRIASVAANMLTIVPQGGAVLTFLALTKLNHKNGFIDLFIVVLVGSIIAQIIIITTGTLIY